MLRNFIRLGVLFLAAIATANLHAQELVHYWNFNDSETLESLIAPTQSTIGGAAIVHIESGISEIRFTSNTGQDFDVENLNARNGDEALSHLRFNDPIGAALIFELPTTGYQDIALNYATRRSGSGAGTQSISYTINGTDYLPFTDLTITETPSLVSLDFTGVAGADNNPDFAIKIEFVIGDGGDGGNNRIDNFTAEGSFLPNFALMHYWNFNASESVEQLLTPTYTEVGGSLITQIEGGISFIPFTGNTGQDFDVENLNARFGDEAGSHLRFNDPIGGGLLIALPTSGHEGIEINYVTRRSGSGAGSQLVAYTVNGVDFIDFTTLEITTTPSLVTLDFSAIEDVNDNPDFAIRIQFEIGTGGDGGNNRFDNFTAEGFAIGGIDTAQPVVTFNPSNNSVNVPTDVLPTIAFNEPVQLIDGTPITSENILAALDFRLNDSAGETIAFTASIEGNNIIITPTGALANNQTYYLAVLANTLSDLSGNAIDADKSVVFTTIAEQTVFAPGDFAILAYRMNTSDIDDEFAFVTFVDILPGTLINIADNKYTTNPQPQCAGGILWTAPEGGVSAGTVVLIGNDQAIADIGTVTGSGFGLSSNGDQIIMYTGSAENPSYITALSSNAWVLENTSCSGSNSILPVSLEDGISSINLSTAPDAAEGNLVNGYYSGPQDLSFEDLKSAILDPANWVGTGGGTEGQIWPLWAFESTPSVVAANVLNQTSIQLFFNQDLNEASAEDLSNYTGIDGLESAELIIGEDGAKEVILVFNIPFTSGELLSLTVANVQNADGAAMEAPFVFEFSYVTTLAFNEEYYSFGEAEGTVEIALTLSNPSVSGANLVLKPSPWSNIDENDITFSDVNFNFDGASAGEVLVSISLNDDADEEQDEYFTLELQDASGLTIEGTPFITVYIRDNDRLAPSPSLEIELNHISSYQPDLNGESTTEVIVYEKDSQRLFATSAIQNRLDIIDFSNPSAPAPISSVDMTPYGGLTSVTVANGYLAVASPNADEQLNGSVVFFDLDGNFVNQVEVGALPDMITVTPDGTKILTANEGQPNNAYTIDPEGSISVIDISAGIPSIGQADVVTLGFESFNAMEAELIANGVRKTFAASTLSQDLEPEFITINESSTTAWVSLQENNAIGEIDLVNLEIVSIKGMGMKDFNVFGNGFDPSDDISEIHLSNFPLKSFYMPDAIANYSVAGTRYIVTANEGDEKEYGPLNERTTVGNNGTVLDPTIFPHAEMLKQPHNLGRLRITNLNGDTDGDGDYDELVMVGSRSFSILNAETMETVYESGDDFELITANDPVFAPVFNASNDDNDLKSRSRSKGPEPEGVAVAEINGLPYAFIALERTGGLMVYNIADPANPVYVDYKNTRTVEELGGDLGPEVVIYIGPEDSPDGKAYALISNEISGTITVFEVLNVEGPTESACYAAEVLEYVQGTKRNGSALDSDRIDANQALNEPDRVDAVGGFVSLGYGGSISLAFNGAVLDAEGNDILVWETSYNSDDCLSDGIESAFIELSQDGLNWVAYGDLCRDGGVDIASTGLEYVVAIRISNNEESTTFDGYDVDGVEAVNGCSAIPDLADCFGSEVLSYVAGPRKNGAPLTEPNRINPEKALGAPQLDDTFNFVSLGYGGELIIGFGGAVADLPGDDIAIAETTFGNSNFETYPESADVYVTNNGVDYILIGSVVTSENASFDISTTGLDYITAVKVVDTTPEGSVSDDGFDVDGIVALNGCGSIPDVLNGACYAAEVVEFNQGTKSNGMAIQANRSNPAQALDAPERSNSMVFVSLGYGGTITMAFDGAIPNGDGYDIEVVETTYGNNSCASYPEYADVYLSQNGVQFFYAATVCKNDGFVEIDDAGQGFEYVNYVRIENNDELTTSPDGFDLDGLVAIYNCEAGEEDGDTVDPMLSDAEVVAELSSAPNPTSGPSFVTFSTAATSMTKLELYDMNGRAVATLFEQVANEGQEYRLDFDGTYLPNGIYVYRLTTANSVVIEKLMIAK